MNNDRFVRLARMLSMTPVPTSVDHDVNLDGEPDSEPDWDSMLPPGGQVPRLIYIGGPDCCAARADDDLDNDLCDGRTLRQVLREYILSLPPDVDRDREFETAWLNHIWPYFGRRRADTLLPRNVFSWSVEIGDCAAPTRTAHIAVDLVRQAYEKQVLDGKLRINPVWEFDDMDKRLERELEADLGPNWWDRP